MRVFAVVASLGRAGLRGCAGAGANKTAPCQRANERTCTHVSETSAPSRARARACVCSFWKLMITFLLAPPFGFQLFYAHAVKCVIVLGVRARARPRASVRPCSGINHDDSRGLGQRRQRRQVPSETCSPSPPKHVSDPSVCIWSLMAEILIEFNLHRPRF